MWSKMSPATAGFCEPPMFRTAAMRGTWFFGALSSAPASVKRTVTHASVGTGAMKRILSSP
jgi:hypothetical protein